MQRMAILVSIGLLGLRGCERAPEIAPDPSWHTCIVDRAGDVGYDTSLALDQDGHPHIACWDMGSEHLKYARWNGSVWQIEALPFGERPRQPSLVVDREGRPHISYMDLSTYHEGNLMYAVQNDATWDIQTVAGGGDVGYENCLALDNEEKPHIVYQSFSQEAGHLPRIDLLYATLRGAEWQLETVQFGGQVGRDASLAMDDRGYPHIAYLGEGVDYAARNGSSWQIETIDTTGGMGHRALALDAAGKPSVAYVKYNALVYAVRSDASWQNHTVRAVEKWGRQLAETSLCVDEQGTAHIAFTDHNHGDYDLYYAVGSGTDWDVQLIERAGSSGEYPSIALDSEGYAHISYGGAGELKYATNNPDAASVLQAQAQSAQPGGGGASAMPAEPPFWVFFFGIAFLSFLSWAILVFALWDCAQRDFPYPKTRALWCLLVALVQLIGPVVYLLVVYRTDCPPRQQPQPPPPPPPEPGQV